MTLPACCQSDTKLLKCLLMISEIVVRISALTIPVFPLFRWTSGALYDSKAILVWADQLLNLSARPS